MRASSEQTPIQERAASKICLWWSLSLNTIKTLNITRPKPLSNLRNSGPAHHSARQASSPEPIGSWPSLPRLLSTCPCRPITPPPINRVSGARSLVRDTYPTITYRIFILDCILCVTQGRITNCTSAYSVPVLQHLYFSRLAAARPISGLGLRDISHGPRQLVSLLPSRQQPRPLFSRPCALVS